MIERLIEFSIHNRAVVIAAACLLAAFGGYAALHTPVDAVPDLSENQAIVFTEWPGHSPREIEDQITYPLSRTLQSLNGIRAVRGSSDVNYSMIYLIFNDDVNFFAARERIRERLSGLSDSMPAGVVPKLAPDAIPTGQIYWYTIEGAGYDLGKLRDVQDWFVKPQLESVAGVAEVASVGGHVVEYHVNLDPQRLNERGIDPSAVAGELARSNAAVGGDVIHKGSAEYIVRGVGWLGSDADSPENANPSRIIRDLENTLIASRHGRAVRLGDVAQIAIGTRPRRGILEKDGNEVVGGVVLMRYGENPLEITRGVKAKIRELKSGLPTGVTVVTGYERTPLILGAVRTVTTTVLEAMLTATVCVVLVLLHFRTSFVVAVTLPLSALASFAVMWVLRQWGIADIQTNIMSLAGIAISIGVLVDSSIVIAENVMHELRERYGDEPVRGDTRAIVLAACRTVGRPIFLSVMIMLVSFLPVFALAGIDGKMYRPLAFTKTFALLSVALLAVTLVPALCTIFIKGRIRRETDSWIVHSVVEVYRPVLAYLFEHPGVLVWILGITLILGAAPVGNRPLFLAVLGFSLVLSGCSLRSFSTRIVGMAILVVVALISEQQVVPLTAEMRLPLDEQMVMDMPLTVPRVSSIQSGDDLKARDMVLCRFPEVEMVLGKAGRAESAFDPAPLDMIETMVMLHPHDFWPRRKLANRDARAEAAKIFQAFVAAKLIEEIADPQSRQDLIDAALMEGMARFDAQMREFAYQSNQELVRSFSGASTSTAEHGSHAHSREWGEHIHQLNGDLLDRAPAVFVRVMGEEFLKRAVVLDPSIAEIAEQVSRARQVPFMPSANQATPVEKKPASTKSKSAGGHHDQHAKSRRIEVMIDPHPALDKLYKEQTQDFAKRIMLWRCERDDLSGKYGGELDTALLMPGWRNVWTMPIQNRVDMLNSGVNTDLGVRVLGRRQEEVVRVSEEIAAALRQIRGVAGASVEQVRGKGYLEIRPDRERAARLGVSIGELNELIETAIGGTIATTTVEGRERHAVRVRYLREWSRDEESIRRIPVPVRELSRGGGELQAATDRSAFQFEPPTEFVNLEEVAAVQITEGPATIKSQNGLVRNHVLINVRGRNHLDLVKEARQAIDSQIVLPEGTYVEWTGQFEHALATGRTLAFVVPIVVAIIFLILVWTFHDWADAVLMLLAVPGTAAVGLIFQWLFGFKFSLAVAVGYIACFGMAASTGMIMLVYLREAVDKAGGLRQINLPQLRQAVMDGAVHRLRPKLLTEGTMILGLAPMLWASGIGSEVIRPMAAPVLGGILIADEVIDLLLPVLFYHVRRRRWLKLHPHGTENNTPKAAIDTNF